MIADGRCCLTAPSLPKIPLPGTNRLPSNIPLRTLPGHHHSRSGQSTSLLAGHPADHPRSSGSSSGDDSWFDTGDIAEQLAEEEDSLRARLHATLDDDTLASVIKRHPKHHPKRVRYHESVPSHPHDGPAHPGAVNKEAIEVPDTAVRRVTWAERAIAAIMTGGTGIHGLTGKPLMYRHLSIRRLRLQLPLGRTR